MSQNKRGSSGFTLIELIVALSLSAFVLVGIMMVATSMISYQLDGARHGSAEGMALVASSSLVHDLRDATYLARPVAGAPGDVLAGCTNWSTAMNGGSARINPSAPNDAECGGAGNVKAFYYCTPNQTSDARLVRYFRCGNTCSIPAVGTCGNPAGSATMQTIVYSKPGFYHMDGLNYYYDRADDVTGVGLHYIVGVGTPTAPGASGQQVRVPVSYKFNMRVGMIKSYNNTND